MNIGGVYFPANVHSSKAEGAGDLPAKVFFAEVTTHRPVAGFPRKMNMGGEEHP
jgi:hypothetical protein